MPCAAMPVKHCHAASPLPVIRRDGLYRCRCQRAEQQFCCRHVFCYHDYASPHPAFIPAPFNVAAAAWQPAFTTGYLLPLVRDAAALPLRSCAVFYPYPYTHPCGSYLDRLPLVLRTAFNPYAYLLTTAAVFCLILPAPFPQRWFACTCTHTRATTCHLGYPQAFCISSAILTAPPCITATQAWRYLHVCFFAQLPARQGLPPWPGAPDLHCHLPPAPAFPIACIPAGHTCCTPSCVPSFHFSTCPFSPPACSTITTCHPDLPSLYTLWHLLPTPFPTCHFPMPHCITHPIAAFPCARHFRTCLFSSFISLHLHSSPHASLSHHLSSFYHLSLILGLVAGRTPFITPLHLFVYYLVCFCFIALCIWFSLHCLQ